MSQTPSMGRMVHYVGHDGEAAPAIIRATYAQAPGRVDLTAFYAFGCHAVREVEHSESHANHSWHWPELPQAEATAPDPHELVVRIAPDGDRWCALAGENLQEGIAGFGETPADALRDFATRFEAFGVALHAAGLA